MKDPKKVFHYISYLQYPLMLVGVFYCYRPFFDHHESIWSDINKGLIFFGLGISFSTLQDTTKTQNKLSKRIFENPKYAKRFLILIAAQAIFFVLMGMFGLFISEKTPLMNFHLVLFQLESGLLVY